MADLMTVSAFEPSNPSQNKEAFLATLSHELRNPLAPILAGVDVILKSPGNPEVVTEVAAMLRSQNLDPVWKDWDESLLAAT